MSNFELTAPCGCVIAAYDNVPVRHAYRYELKPCALHGAAQEMLNACKLALAQYYNKETPAAVVLQAAITKAEAE